MDTESHLVSVTWSPHRPPLGLLLLANTSQPCPSRSDLENAQTTVTVESNIFTTLAHQWQCSATIYLPGFTWIVTIRGETRAEVRLVRSFLLGSGGRRLCEAQERSLLGGQRPVRRCETNKAQRWIMRHHKSHYITWAMQEKHETIKMQTQNSKSSMYNVNYSHLSCLSLSVKSGQGRKARPKCHVGHADQFIPV